MLARQEDRMGNAHIIDAVRTPRMLTAAGAVTRRCLEKARSTATIIERV